jgi:hypothetical protein
VITGSCGFEDGFVRTSNGIVTRIAVPGATFTSPQEINPLGAITGYYRKFPGLPAHGFLRIP